MSVFENQETLVWANYLVLSVLIGSGILWFRRWRIGRKQSMVVIQPWIVAWLDFALFIWVTFVVFLAVMMGMERFVFPNTEISFPSDGSGVVTWPMIIFGMSVQLALVFCLLGAKYFYKIQYFSVSLAWKSIFTPFFKGADSLIRYLPLLWLAAGLSVWVFQKLGIGSGEQETITLLVAIDNPWMYLVSMGSALILAPVLEELFFRGIILRFLLGKMQPIAALMISAGIFSALHFNLDSFIPIFILGFLLGKIYSDTGDIRCAICMHALFNGHTALLISLDRWVF